MTSTPLLNPLRAVKVSRSCNVPEIRTRAFYELVRSPKFDLTPQSLAYTGNSDLGPYTTSLPIHPDDLLKALSIREALQLQWVTETNDEDHRTHRSSLCPLHQPNNPDANAPPSQAGCLTDDQRHRFWATLVAECGVFDVGSLDPIEGARQLSEKQMWRKYCDGCAQLQHDIWTRIREKLWAKLEEMVKSE